MKFQERTITLKDGRNCILRPVLPEYAEEMINYLKKTSAETDFLLRYPDEVTFTLEAEQELLTRFYEDPRTVMMAAFVDGRLAGNSSITPEATAIRIKDQLSMRNVTSFLGMANLLILEAGPPFSPCGTAQARAAQAHTVCLQGYK